VNREVTVLQIDNDGDELLKDAEPKNRNASTTAAGHKPVISCGIFFGPLLAGDIGAVSVDGKAVDLKSFYDNQTDGHGDLSG